jgi:hypothetical protein
MIIILFITRYFVALIPPWHSSQARRALNPCVLQNASYKTRIITYIQGVSAKTFEPNISVICQRIFMKFKMQIF